MEIILDQTTKLHMKQTVNKKGDSKSESSPYVSNFITPIDYFERNLQESSN